MSIRIYYDNTAYRLRQSRKIIRVIEKVIRFEKKTTGDLYFIMTDDDQLLSVNKEFLQKNTLTDVIAFDYGKNKTVAGEIYISVDTVRRNANNYKVSLRNELIRVMIHGTLHLCGYKDSSERQKTEMRRNEDKWIESIYGSK